MRDLLIASCCIALLLATQLAAAEPASRYRLIEPNRDGIGKVYMGREIAGVMGWQAAGWLEREERDREERSSLLVRMLDLRPGMVIADVGAGTGYFSRRFAAQVGPSGIVYAVDVQPQMLQLLQSLAQGSEFKQIRPILSTVDDAKLPPSSVDLAIMIDVYHELEYPYEMLASVVRALKPDGRVVFVEYRAEDDSVPIKRLHKMSIAQIKREASPHGLRLVDSIRGLPWQHVLVFKKTAP